MKKLKWTKMGALIALLFWSSFFFRSPAAISGDDFRIKFSTVAPKGSTWIKHMESLDQELRAKSNGRLGIKIYPGGVLGDEIDVLKKIRIGQVHCAGFSGVGFGSILPEVRVLDLPFLFRNTAETDLVHKELRSYFAERFEDKGFHLLGWGEVGDVYVYSKQAIGSVEDFNGLKVWSWSGDPIAKETFSAMGVNPILLAITDVTTAINTGTIDTVYAPPLAALALQWYVPMKTMMGIPLAHSTGAVLISSRYMDKLPQDLSQLLRESFQNTLEDLIAVLREKNREAVEIIRESGLTISPPPSGPRLHEFYDVHDKVAERLSGELYPRELLERVYRILRRTR